MIYLASPYTDEREEVRNLRARAAVKSAAALMIYRGEAVFSPIAHSHEIFLTAAGRLPMTFEFWRPLNIGVLSICNRVIVLELPGWKRSAGIADEVDEAGRLGLPVEYLQVARYADRDGHRRLEVLEAELVANGEREEI